MTSSIASSFKSEPTHQRCFSQERSSPGYDSTTVRTIQAQSYPFTPTKAYKVTLQRPRNFPHAYRVAPVSSKTYSPPTTRLQSSYCTSRDDILSYTRLSQIRFPYNQSVPSSTAYNTTFASPCDDSVVIGRKRYSQIDLSASPYKDYEGFSEPNKTVSRTLDIDPMETVPRRHISDFIVHDGARGSIFESVPIDVDSMETIPHRHISGFTVHDGARGSIFETVPGGYYDGSQKDEAVTEFHIAPTEVSSQPRKSSKSNTSKRTDLSKYTNDPSITALIEKTGLKDYLSNSSEATSIQSTHEPKLPFQTTTEGYSAKKSFELEHTSSFDENSLSFTSKNYDGVESTFDQTELTETDDDKVRSKSDDFDTFTKSRSHIEKDNELLRLSTIAEEQNRRKPRDNRLKSMDGGVNRNDDQDFVFMSKAKNGALSMKNSSKSFDAKQRTKSTKSVFSLSNNGLKQPRRLSVGADAKRQVSSTVGSYAGSIQTSKTSLAKPDVVSQTESLSSTHSLKKSELPSLSYSTNYLSSNTNKIKKLNRLSLDSDAVSKISSLLRSKEGSTKASQSSLTDTVATKTAFPGKSGNVDVVPTNLSTPFGSKQKIKEGRSWSSDNFLQTSQHPQKREYQSLSFHSPGSPNLISDQPKHVSFEDFYFSKDKSKFHSLDLKQTSLKSNLGSSTSAGAAKRPRSFKEIFHGATSSTLKVEHPSTEREKIEERVSLSDATEQDYVEKASNVSIGVPEHFPGREYRSKSYHFPDSLTFKADKPTHTSFEDFYFARDKSKFQPLNLKQGTFRDSLDSSISAGEAERRRSSIENFDEVTSSSALRVKHPSTKQNKVRERVSLDDTIEKELDKTSDISIGVSERPRETKYRSSSYHFPGSSIFTENTNPTHMSFEDFYFAKDKSKFHPLNMEHGTLKTNLDASASAELQKQKTTLKLQKNSNFSIAVSERPRERKFRSESYQFSGSPIVKQDAPTHVSFEDFSFAKDKSNFNRLNLKRKSLTTNVDFSTTADTAEKRRSTEVISDKATSKSVETLVRMSSTTLEKQQDLEEKNETKKFESGSEFSYDFGGIAQSRLPFDANSAEASPPANELNVPKPPLEQASSYSGEESAPNEIDRKTESS